MIIKHPLNKIVELVDNRMIDAAHILTSELREGGETSQQLPVAKHRTIVAGYAERYAMEERADTVRAAP